MKRKKIIPSLLLVSLLTSCSLTGERQPIEKYMLDLTYKDGYKILQLTDIHLSAQDDLQEDYKFMDLSINESTPDLIVLTGDTFITASREVIDSFFEYLDKKDIPWAFTYGNHDEEGSFNPNYINDKILSSKNSIFANFSDDVTGSSNYIINLKQENKIKYQLYIIDSNSYHPLGWGYDYIHDDQVEWYERGVNKTTELTGSVVNSLAFFHIPLIEYKTAYEQYINGEISGSGINKENVSASSHNSGLFNKMKQLGSTKAVFVGHDHINDSHIMYQGIELCYGVKSTDNIYHDEAMMGSTLITINSTTSYSVERHFHTYKEIR